MRLDRSERRNLEKEVKAHLHRIEEIQEALRDREENLSQVVGAPEELVREVNNLRLELRGRKAALAVGLAVLGTCHD